MLTTASKITSFWSWKQKTRDIRKQTQTQEINTASLSVSQNCIHKAPSACAVNNSTLIPSTADASGPTHARTRTRTRTPTATHTREGISLSAPASSSSRTLCARPNCAAKLSAVCLHCASDAQHDARKQNKRKQGEIEIEHGRQRERERERPARETREREYVCDRQRNVNAEIIHQTLKRRVWQEWNHHDEHQKAIISNTKTT
jgi:hypothetical protein